MTNVRKQSDKIIKGGEEEIIEAIDYGCVAKFEQSSAECTKIYCWVTAKKAFL